MNQPILYRLEQFGPAKRKGFARANALAHSNRFTLGCALVIAIIVPEILHMFARESFGWACRIEPGEPSLFVSAFALVWAHILLRKVGILPLVNDKMLILPAFLVSYATAYGALAMTLRYFSLYHLVTGFGLGVTWYFFTAVMRARSSSPRLALAGDLMPDALLLASRIEWLSLDEPRLPRNVHGIVFDKSREYSPAWERVFSRAVLRNIPIYEITHLRELMAGRVLLLSQPQGVFGDLLPSQPYLRVKRLIDTIVAIPALILASPVILALGLAIRLESPGPALFRQERIGYQGRRFTCYKLRTMRTGIDGPAYTAQTDPRITRLGRSLRKWRLDELPQIANILKGEMSWIGPRPEAIPLARAYERTIPFYTYRYAVRPGISGWAAVHQGNVALADAVMVKLEYDFYYLKYFSIWLDFLIVLMTIKTVATGFGHR